MKLILIACCIVLAAIAAEALSNPEQVRSAAEHVLREIGYPAMPQLVKEVMTGILMLQLECPRYGSMPMVIAGALVKKYRPLSWGAWEVQARKAGVPTVVFVRNAMKFIQLSMVADLRASPLGACY